MTLGDVPTGRAARWIELQQEIIKQDFFTWENMQYLEKPSFAVEEAKNYASLRRWCRRFYPADTFAETIPFGKQVTGESPASPWEPTPGNGLTFSGILDAQVAVRPDQPLLVIDDVPLTYRALQERSISVANVLAGLGIGPGDRVALFMGTSPEWVTLWFGLCRLGAVAVPINTAYRGDFLANQLRDSNTKMIALDRSLADRVFSIAADVPSLRAVLLREDGKPSRPTPNHAAPPSHVEVHSIEQLLEGDTSQVEGHPDLAPFPLGAIFSTSGTTGRSKGVLATQHYLLRGGAGHGGPLAAPAR